MSAKVLLNLLNKLRKDKMGGLLNILLRLFCNEFNNKLYNTEAQDYSIYGMMLIFFFIEIAFFA